MAKIGLSSILGMAVAAGALAVPAPELDLAPPKDGETSRVAVFAGGCFWCTEAVFEQLEGVTDVVSGYAGDTKEKAVYGKVSNGETKHAEAIRITYDPRKVTYGQLLHVLFSVIDPTTVNGQHPDYGPHYRSAVFYATDEEKKVVEAYIAQVEKAKAFPKPIALRAEPIGLGFFEAEKYHQDFAKLNPDHPYVRQWSDKKVAKVKEKFEGQIKR